MKKDKLLFIFFFIIFLINEINASVLLSDDLITEINLSKLNYTFIKQKSKIFTNKTYQNFKFFKIDFTSIDEITEQNIFSFIKISIKPIKENTYKSFFLYVNKTLFDFYNSTEYTIDFNIHDKNPTIFLPKKFYNENKYFYFFIQGDTNTEFEYSIEAFINNTITIKEIDNKFNILFRPGVIELYYKIKENNPKGYLLISLLTCGVIEDAQNLFFDVICINDEDNDIALGNFYPYYINGVGRLITDKEINNCKKINNNDGEKFSLLKIILYNNSTKALDIEFNSQYLEKEKNKNEFITKTVYENTVYTSLILGENKKCFKFKQEIEDREIFNDYEFNIRTISSDMIISHNSEDNKKKEKKIMFTGLVEFNIVKNKFYYLCVTNNKKYDAGIQFQIMPKFGTDISKIAKKPLLSLINGFPTYLKIGKNKAMAYKVDLRQFQHIDNKIGYYREKNKIVKYHLISKNQAKINMYHLQCQKFAIDLNQNTCQKLNNNIYKINLDLYINYYYQNQNSLYYNEYVLVECEDEIIDCEFLLDVNLLDETDSYPIQLINSEDSFLDHYYKPISKMYIDEYKISLSNKLKANSKLYIILYMFSGDADLSLYDYNDNISKKELQRVIQNTEYTSIGKKKYLVYDIKSINNKLNYNLREIILKVTGLSNGFYSLKYYTLNNDGMNKKIYFSLPFGETNFDKITYGDGEKVYSLLPLLSIGSYSHNDDESNEYYININALNCILEVEFMGKNYINREIQLFFKEKDIKSILKLKLHELDSKNKNNNEHCIYYIMSNSVKNTENIIIINEGVVHTMTLDDKTENISYRYPYVFNDNMVSISLYKYLKEDLSVNVNINDMHTTHSFTMKNIYYKKIVIYANKLREICLKGSQIASRYKDFINLCPININIELPNKVKKNKFQLEIISSGKTPTYIRNGEIKFDSFVVNQYSTSGRPNTNYVYYYTDIGKNEYPCEIIINTKFGSCEAVAKIVTKDNIDMFPNWDRRVRLPTYDDNDKTDYIKYDYELSKFIIKKKDLKKCDNGCEIYIAVFSRETSMYFQINDFFIMLTKNYKKEPINLLFNQNIDNALTKNADTQYYISHLENENINKLVFTFNSDYGSLCIIMVDNNSNNNNEGYDLKKLNKCDWKLDNIVNGYKNYMLSIKSTDNKLKGKDLTSIKFISKISSQIKNNNYNSYYSFKINKQLSVMPMIINVDSINNEIAQLDIDTGLAYYAIRIQEYQIINEIDLVVISEEKIINDNLFLYAKVINQKDYNNDGFNETIIKEDYTNFEIKSNNELKNHLNIKLYLKKEQEDKIIFLVVKCNAINEVDSLMNHYIKIMVAFYKPNTNNSLKNNHLKLYHIEHQSPKFFIPLTQDKYSIVVVNCLKGDGEIKFDDLNDYKEYNETMDMSCNGNNNGDNNKKKEFKFVLDLNNNIYDYEKNENKFSTIKLNTKDYSVSKGNSFMFYISYYNKYIRNNLEFIDINKENKIFYPIINNIRNHNSLSYYLNVNALYNKDLLIEISFNNKYLKDENNLNVLSALINDEFIYENIINEQHIIFSPLYGTNYYNKENNNIYVLFKNNDIKKYKSYFGYALISISNNFFNYDIIDDNSFFFVKINVIENDNNKLNDCIEIINKYSNAFNNNNNNDGKNTYIEDNNSNSYRSFIKKIILVLIILIVIVIILLTYRCIRRRKIGHDNDYFNSMAPILN